ncbi:protein-tyrosine-phosphatase MKP1 isoform X2 [Hevea brasiliensis]|uniref:protein-tyrosine-phosphatase MKP1 isoform X2 n=1 Tax=Hevea brasiliensis TaxID=3981 RepID=UPI0025DA6185|nr:protein-tyrosine-phosphatase MKP1 isoform X2 [Hevea brasiliensis]
MVGEGNGNPLDSPRLPSAAGSRKMFWRSASWSSSRTALQNPEAEEKDCVMDPNVNDIGKSSNVQNRRYPVPLTPRSQQNCKARSCLPPLQPLSIARRSLDEWPKAGSDDLGEWPLPTTPSGNRCGERLKLDLSSIQRNPDRNAGLVKRDKIAFFDKECSKVAEHVYLGGDAVARDREILKQNGITHVLNCVGFVCPEYFKTDFVYRTLWLQDSPSEDITSILYDVFDYFEDVREQGGRVFVHCCQGVSRSTSLVIAYLMWREGQSFDDAFQYVKAARGIADPNMGFACQLLQCQKRVHAFPLSPTSLLRMYRIAPHSPYDPLHLVPKMLNEPSPSALDSRGAFIVHIPSTIYIWIGKNCEAIMERDARGAVCQIVRYERAQGPIIVVKEGEEPVYFWDAFSNYLPLMDKSSNGVDIGPSAIKICPGERKVDVYNVDFEIFQKAIKGGFVPSIAPSENEHEIHLPARESSWSVLRRKFAPVDMKEFISAPKIFLSRVYSDSMMIVHSSSPSSSSSSSPPYLSPDSISSESSTSSKYSESSLDSPSPASCSVLVSSPSSNFDNLSLLSSKASSWLPSDTPGHRAVYSMSNQCSQVTSSTSKKSSPSLAERRGSLSKSLKLPVMTDNLRVTSTPPSLLASQEDGARINKNTFSWRNSNSIEIVLESKNQAKGGKDSMEKSKLNISQDRLVSADSCDREAAFVNNCDGPDRYCLSGEGLGCSIANGIQENVSSSCNIMQSLVCHWPSLERIATFGTSNLDSKAAFAILAPATGLGRDGSRILYFWIGRSFPFDESLIHLDCNKVLMDGNFIDSNQVGCRVLTQMGLPKDIPVKHTCKWGSKDV